MRIPRLFVDQELLSGQTIYLSEAQAHYLFNVLRVSAGAKLQVFNGKDGEWSSNIISISRNRCLAKINEQVREQLFEKDIWLIFAPIKRSRIDFVVSKATELGVSSIKPVFTNFTDVKRVNIQRLKANVIEAAEQCGRLSVPVVCQPQTLKTLIDDWPVDRDLFYCDETGNGSPINQALNAAKISVTSKPTAILIGPEGGFSQSELDLLNKKPNFTAIDLGPRILRADTAAIAALSCWQAIIGDWGEK